MPEEANHIEIAKDDDGPNWRVFIRRSDGPSEMQLGFTEEAEAREWAAMGDLNLLRTTRGYCGQAAPAAVDIARHLLNTVSGGLITNWPLGAT